MIGVLMICTANICIDITIPKIYNALQVQAPVFRLVKSADVTGAVTIFNYFIVKIDVYHDFASFYGVRLLEHER